MNSILMTPLEKLVPHITKPVFSRCVSILDLLHKKEKSTRVVFPLTIFLLDRKRWRSGEWEQPFTNVKAYHLQTPRVLLIHTLRFGRRKVNKLKPRHARTQITQFIMKSKSSLWSLTIWREHLQFWWTYSTPMTISWIPQMILSGEQQSSSRISKIFPMMIGFRILSGSPFKSIWVTNITRKPALLSFAHSPWWISNNNTILKLPKLSSTNHWNWLQAFLIQCQTWTYQNSNVRSLCSVFVILYQLVFFLWEKLT